MKQIELKKECSGRDKKSQVDRNRRKNHAKFQKTYTGDGVNLYQEPSVDEAAGLPLHFQHSDQSPAHHTFKVNALFDVLCSEDRVVAEQQPQRRDALDGRRRSAARNERYEPLPEEGTLGVQERDPSASKAKSTLDADARTMAGRNSAIQLQEVSELADANIQVVHQRAEADLVAQPINVELKTSAASNAHTKQEQLLHPKSAAPTRKYSDFNPRPQTNNTMR